MSYSGGRGGGGDMGDLRDTFVSYLMKAVIDRMERHEKIMIKVSGMFDSIKKMFMGNEITDPRTMRVRLARLTEPQVIIAVLVVSGDEDAMANFIYRANLLSYQIMRPSPRFKRTQQLFNDLDEAWRIACGYHQRNWENILQLNSSQILTEVPIVKGQKFGIGDFLSKVRKAMTAGIIEGEKKEEK